MAPRLQGNLTRLAWDVYTCSKFMAVQMCRRERHETLLEMSSGEREKGDIQSHQNVDVCLNDVIKDKMSK